MGKQNDKNMDHWSRAAIQQNRQWLIAYVYSMTGKSNETEDLIQEVFTIAWQKKDSFREGTNFGGWLREIARRVILRHYKKASSKPLFISDKKIMVNMERAAERLSPFMMDETETEKKVTLLKKCMQELSGKLKTLIRLKYTEKLSSTVIGKKMEMSVGHINVAAYKARTALFKCMKKNIRLGINGEVGQ